MFENHISNHILSYLIMHCIHIINRIKNHRHYWHYTMTDNNHHHIMSSYYLNHFNFNINHIYQSIPQTVNTFNISVSVSVWILSLSTAFAKRTSWWWVERPSSTRSWGSTPLMMISEVCCMSFLAITTLQSRNGSRGLGTPGSWCQISPNLPKQLWWISTPKAAACEPIPRSHCVDGVVWTRGPAF